jgi:hypothetical protein
LTSILIVGVVAVGNAGAIVILIPALPARFSLWEQEIGRCSPPPRRR